MSDKSEDKGCHMCGALMTSSIIPIKRYSRDGVFAVDSVIQWICPTGEECESGGGYQSWKAIGRLDDLSKEITKRPLYARHNPETNYWDPCPDPHYDLEEDRPVPWGKFYRDVKGDN